MEAWFDDVVCTGQSELPKQTLVDQEFANYTTASEEAQSMLAWWSQHGHIFPRISVLAKKYLAVPASSVPAERVFSLAGNLVNKKRARMSPDTIDTMIFMNRNMKAFW